MITFDKFNADNLPHIETVRSNKKIEYLNIECGFDIETSSVYVESRKNAFMYIWVFGLGLEHENIYGRTWEEFLHLTDILSEKYILHDERRLIIYVHNLGYEFQFMRKYFEWKSVFASDERKPLKALTTNGIEFRDSYMLSGYNLNTLANNLVEYKVEKLVGDLDYSLVRHYDTPMTKEELAYCDNDVTIIKAYIKEQIKQYDDNINNLPLTNTGRVRQLVRENCYKDKTDKKKSKRKYFKYRKIMEDLTLTVDDYKQLKQAFMGGFTHASSIYSGQTLENVSSIDFTSSYPSVMLSEKFPMSRPKVIEIESEKQLMQYINSENIGCLFDVTFQNIECKIPQENYISESKCHKLDNPLINNGRVYSANYLKITLTDVDFRIIKAVYKWDNIAVSNFKIYQMDYLPKPIIESLLNLYIDKTQLKGVENKEVEYLLSKGMLNSVYGMTVTDIVRDEHNYNNIDGWFEETGDTLKQIDKYNKSKNRFLYYAWGVWITAYARFNLWTGILAMGTDYVYSDTDSIKLLNYNDHIEYINKYNDVILSKIYAMLDNYKLPRESISPKNKQGKSKTIGIWDYEGNYSKFKTLGAKRYLVLENDELHLTLAGLSKQNGVNYMLEQCNHNIDKVFKMFNDDLYIPSKNTGKNTHTYIDYPSEFYITDYKGVKRYIKTLSAVHLEATEFTLSIAEQYKIFLQNFKEGYIYKGVKYQ